MCRTSDESMMAQEIKSSDRFEGGGRVVSSSNMQLIHILTTGKT